MADTVTVNTVIDNGTHVVVHLTCISDGTGETGVKKVDIAAIAANVNGKQPAGLRLEQIRWCMQGFAYLKLGWDRTAAQNTLMTPNGSGYDDYRGLKHGVRDYAKLGGLVDPSEGNADNKGSILLTSVGAVAGATYDVTLWLAKANN